MVTVRSRTLAHHTFKRAIRKVHRLNPPVLPSEESHAVSVRGTETSCLCASMPYAAFPLHCHHSDGAGNQGLQYIPCLDALHSPHFSLYKTAISLRRVAQRQSTVGLNSPSIFICCSFCGSKQSFQKPPTYNPQDFPLLAVFSTNKLLKDNSSCQNPLVIVVFLG